MHRLLRGAKIFDGETPDLLEGFEVLVGDGRILELSDRPIKSDEATVIDLRGRTLMPGLIDAHVHVLAAKADLASIAEMPRMLLAQHARQMLEAMLNRGFTTVRDMAGADYGLAEALTAGLIKGPRLFYGGKALSQTGGHGDMRPRESSLLCGCPVSAGGDFAHIVDGVSAVRRAAREELRRGAHHIKIMASGGVASPHDPIWNLQFSEEEIRAAVWEAKSWRAYVAAHAYTPEAIRRAIEFGVRSIEHANLIDADTAKHVAANEVFVVPTLATYEAIDRFGKDQGMTAVSLSKLAEVQRAGQEALEYLRAAGATVGFGTDLLGPMQAAQGREFLLRHDVFPAADILRQATSNNAALLQRKGILGCIKPGALADLIAVDGNPLQDLSLFEGDGGRISMIMLGGDIHRLRSPS